MALKIIDYKIYLGDIFLGDLHFKSQDTVHSIKIEELYQDELFRLSEDKICNNVEVYYDTKDFSLTILKENNQTYITKVFPSSVFDWGKNISINEYNELILSQFTKIGDVEITTDLDFDDLEVFNIFLSFKLENDLTIHDAVNEINRVFKELDKQITSINNIVSHIKFKREHLKAGISILQNFGKLLNERYPNEKVSVSIKQEDLKVTMIVETPDGKKEEIEEYLNRYGMVIMNQLPPEEFASNPIQLLELKHELRDAQNKIISQQEILALKDETYKNSILSLEDDLKFLREEFSAIRRSNDKSINTLLSSLLSKDKLIKKLTKSIDKKDELETKQLLLELKDKDNNGYIGLKQHLDNAMIGGIVNAPSWIQFTMGIITKL